MSLQQIINYMPLSERLASSGQPAETQFKDIAAAGFEVVLNLAMPNSDNAIPEEGYIVTARKMTYAHLPVPFDNPTPEHLKLFLGLMDAFSSTRCWVHCVVNYRVSAFMYQHYRLTLGATEQEARKVIVPDWQPDEVWGKFMALTAEDIGL